MEQKPPQETLKEIIDITGKSLSSLSFDLQITTTTLYRIHNGEIKTPHRSTIAIIDKYLEKIQKRGKKDDLQNQKLG